MSKAEKPDQIEFEFPDEKEEVKASDEGLKAKGKPEAEEPEVEVVDDTPLQDRNRKPLEREVVDPSDDELQEYSEKVKSRIKELTHARHDERRRKEALEREKEEALRVAQAVFEENKKLKDRLTQGETTYMTQAQQLAEVEVEKAKAALRAAHEAGDTEAIVDAQTLLNKAILTQERVKSFRPAPLRKESESDNVDAQQPAQAPVPQRDTKAEAWKARNSWFGEDDEMTSFALGLHNKLVRSGYNTQSDEYYEAIDARMRQVFPDQFKAEAPEPEKPTKKPATVVAPTQRATSAKKIRLTQTQVAIAKRLGVPLEVYARKLAELEQQNG